MMKKKKKKPQIVIKKGKKKKKPVLRIREPRLPEIVDGSDLPYIFNTTDTDTQQGCLLLYNMLLAKKDVDMRISPESTNTEIDEAREKIITMYQEEIWQSEEEKVTIFNRKVHEAWNVLSER